MEPQLGSQWYDKEADAEYVVVRTTVEDMAMRCKDGETAFIWGWSDSRDSYSLISPEKPNISPAALLTMMLPVTVQMTDTTERYGTVVIYQDLSDHRLYARYADEFLDGRFQKISD